MTYKFYKAFLLFLMVSVRLLLVPVPTLKNPSAAGDTVRVPVGIDEVTVTLFATDAPL